MKSVGEAVDNLHRALSKIDGGVRDRLTTISVGELVNKFGEREEMYHSFKEGWE